MFEKKEQKSFFVVTSLKMVAHGLHTDATRTECVCMCAPTASASLWAEKEMQQIKKKKERGKEKCGTIKWASICQPFVCCAYRGTVFSSSSSSSSSQPSRTKRQHTISNQPFLILRLFYFIFCEL